MGITITNQGLKVSKIRNVKTPTRGTEGSAGIDFYIPNDYPALEIENVMPGQSVFIPSGIKANVPTGFALIAFNKSGVALKKDMTVGACVVDSDYQGEIHLHLTNVGTKPTTLNPGDKLVQFLLVPVDHGAVEVVELDNLYTEQTNRGSGGFGSTGTK